MLTQEDIARMAARIVRGYAPLALGVFGSYAIGTARDGSDLDIFAIKQTLESPSRRKRAVRSLLFGTMCPIDVHVFTPQEFEEAVNEELSFAWIIARQARLQYSCEEAKLRVPSLFLHTEKKEP